MIKPICIILAAFIVLIFPVSCNKDDIGTDCFAYSNAHITEVKGLNSTSVNQEIELTIAYYFYNGCGKFERLDSFSNGNTTTVSIVGKYEGCVCPDILVGGQKVYTFKASQPGMYTLNFLQPNKSILVYTITVN